MRSVALEVAPEWMGVWPEREGCLGVTFQGFCFVIFGAVPLPLGHLGCLLGPCHQ